MTANREVFALRLTPNERDRIEAAAKALGVPASVFVRRAAAEAASGLAVVTGDGRVLNLGDDARSPRERSR